MAEKNAFTLSVFLQLQLDITYELNSYLKIMFNQTDQISYV